MDVLDRQAFLDAEAVLQRLAGSFLAPAPVPVRQEASRSPLEKVLPQQAPKTSGSALFAEEKFQALVQAIPDGLLLSNAEGRIVLANAQAEALFGYRLDELLGQPIELLVPQRYREQHVQHRQDYFANVRTRPMGLNQNLFGLRKDGVEFPVEISLSPLHTAEGLHVISTVRDASARRQAETRLARLETRYRSLVEDIPAVTFMAALDESLNELYISPQIEQLLGYTQAEWLGDPVLWYTRLHPEDKERWHEEFAQTVALGVRFRSEYRFIARSGRVVWILGEAHLIRDPHGKPLYLQGIAFDITERKQAEEILLRSRDSLKEQVNQSEEQLRSVVAHMLDGLIVSDHHGIILSMNPAAEKLFGLPSAERVGQRVLSLLTEAYRQEYLAILERCMQFGPDTLPNATCEAMGLRQDLSTFPLEMAITSFALGSGRFFTWILRDVTERKRVEQTKNEFVSMVSHELRTPLTSIRGSLGLVVGGVGGQLSGQTKKLIDIAHNNCERLIRLINDILDLNKIEAGKMTFDLKEVEVGGLVEHALEANRHYATQYNVGFRLERHAQPVRVQVDADRFQQVLTNLLSNAAKFSPPGEEVVVALRLQGGRVRVAVTDHGSGIPKEAHDRIFQKFSQVDSSNTRKAGGTGLGLALCKAMIEQMGGTIGFLSEPNVQTTFFVELPLLGNEQEAALRLAPLAQQRILICEDDADVASLITRMIRQAGYACDVAGNAAMAKTLLAQSHYQAMILDLVLPDQHGLALIRDLRVDEATRDLPIVVVSVTAHDGKLQVQGRGLQVLDWLSKPIDPQRLTRTVHRAIRQRKSHTGMPHVLHIEDDADMRSLVTVLLGDSAELVAVQTCQEAEQALASRPFDLVILDVGLPDGSGLRLLPLMSRQTPPIPVMVFSARELSVAEALQVQVALVKTRVSNEEFLQTIRSLLQ